MDSQFIIFVDPRLFIHGGMLSSADQDFLNILEDTDPLHLGGALSFGCEV